MAERNNADREVGIERGEEVALQTSAKLDVDEDGKVVGHFTPHRRRPYGASDVIRRGSAARVKMQLAEGEDDEEATPEKSRCLCGCGKFPRGAGSAFLPGHDSKARAIGVQYMLGNIGREQIRDETWMYLTEGGMIRARKEDLRPGIGTVTGDAARQAEEEGRIGDRNAEGDEGRRPADMNRAEAEEVNVPRGRRSDDRRRSDDQTAGTR